MWIGIVSLFPDMFQAVSAYGITGRAVESGILTLETWNPRDFTTDRHKTVDDRPYGGGPGMLMKVQPLRDAIGAAREARHNKEQPCPVVYLSPQGKRLDQQGLEKLCGYQQLILVAGRYEGIDERVVDEDIDEEYSIGDYVLSGGELPAMVMIDGITRLLPGAVGDEQSLERESFVRGLLDYPQYTRPETVGRHKVPEVLLSGNHQEIERWRMKQSLGRTWQRRPDLMNQVELSAFEAELLEELIKEKEFKRNNE